MDVMQYFNEAAIYDEELLPVRKEPLSWLKRGRAPITMFARMVFPKGNNDSTLAGLGGAILYRSAQLSSSGTYNILSTLKVVSEIRSVELSLGGRRRW